jgi:HD-like signal output (HDOD) protein
MNDQAVIRVMFVDDEPRILQGLQRMLRTMRTEWDMCFLEGGAAALAEMERRPADVVVSDMRMPEINGAQLLDTVMKRWPSTVRIILSGHADQELIQRSVGPTHQYLQKPCDAEALKATIARAQRLRSQLGGSALSKLVGGVETLPSLPALYHQLVDLMHVPEVSMRQVGELVAKDIGMSAKVLQLVNSAFFGSRRAIANPVEAVTLLGVDTLSALVLSTPVFARLDAALQSEFGLADLWQKSICVSALAKRIAQSGKLTAIQSEEACMAGMMLDVGRLLLATSCPQRYREVLANRRPGIPQREIESAVLGTESAHVGAYLLGLWGISDPIVEAVAYHLAPHHASALAFSSLTCVHVANALYQDPTGKAADARLDEHYLVALGLDEQVPAWSALARKAKESQS